MGQRTVHLPPGEIAGFIAREAAAVGNKADTRVLIGLAGGPGTGKSTLSEAIVAALVAGGTAAALVPMDGFHMRQDKLDRLGLAQDKGAPHTFEAQAFVDFLAQVKRAHAPISGPVYTRDIEDVTEDGYTIAPEVKIVLVEGNYLLFESEPWTQVRALLDLCVHIEVSREIVRKRLLARHAAHGLFDHDHIERHVNAVDLANYDLVSTTARRADISISVDTPD